MLPIAEAGNEDNGGVGSMASYRFGWSFLASILLAALVLFGGAAPSASYAEGSATGVSAPAEPQILTDSSTNEACLINADGEVLIPYTSDFLYLSPIGQELFVVHRGPFRNTTYALCDARHLLTGFDFSYIDIEYAGDEPRLAASLEELYGYIDRSGQWVIEPRWIFAYAFSEGLALVDLENGGDPDEYGFINTKGEYEIRFTTDQIKYTASYFSEGKVEFLAANGLWGYLDRKGNVVIDPVYLEAFPFSCGYAAVEDETGCYHIDQNGQPLYDERYDYAGYFEYGYAIVGEGYRQYGLISSDGSLVYPISAYSLFNFTSDQMCWIHETKEEGSRLFDMKTGSFVTTETYDRPFYHEGFVWNDEGFIVKKNGLSGFLSKTGELLVPCEYDFLYFNDDDVLCGYIGDGPSAPVPIPGKAE